ncbi:hypothetical protein [Serratia marcescens]|uniref:hypothetical protein n=1 Tax=Serratia marcescens TaxID=615 RepID=UPI0016484013|nr:hypothetical protein [Serratia marcescens]
MTVLRQFVERLHNLERNNIGRPGERGDNYGANAATRWRENVDYSPVWQPDRDWGRRGTA